MKALRFILLSAVSLLLTACFNSPDLNKSAQSYQRIVNQMDLFGIVEHDTATAKQVEAVFTRLYPIAEKYNASGNAFDWQIAVFRSDEMNAWAMPGGKMVLHSALIEKLRLSDDELAMILAHEMVHVVKEHGKEQINIDRAARFLAMFGGVAASSVVNYAGSVVALAPEYAISKPFSRKSELEADSLGLLILAEAGYNPQKAMRLWQKLYEFSADNQGFLQQLVSTHPTYQEREANILNTLAQAMAIYQKSH